MILPTAQPQDYSSATTEYLQQEIDFCKHILDMPDLLSSLIPELNRSYKERVALAEQELERRFLLS